VSKKKLTVADASGFERTYEFDHVRERSQAMLKGQVLAELWDANGELRDLLALGNLITQVGDQYWAERAAGIASPPAQAVGMKLGTGTTAVDKTGAGAALVTYKTGSNVLIASGFPTSSLTVEATPKRRITWKGSWPAGVATDAALAEAVLFNDANANATSSAANTIARVLLSPAINKGATEVLDLTWYHDLLGTAS
jgi:hypothetical protein